MTERVLVVEDNPALLETLTYNLRKRGYAVYQTASGQAALELAREHRPDLVILDLILPDLDGLEVCRILRETSSAPILMLTSRVEEVDKVLGLEMGADDYITKPFSMKELLARVRAQLRRVQLVRDELTAASDTPDEDRQMIAGNLQADLARQEVRLDGETLGMKPKEFQLLVFFMRHRGIVLSRRLIWEQVWDGEVSERSRTIDVHVRWLRQKIEDDPASPVRIVTVQGVGYRFEG